MALPEPGAGSVRSNRHREIGNLYSTFLHAVGDRSDYFGVRDPVLKGDAAGKGPLAELLAWPNDFRAGTGKERRGSMAIDSR